MKMKTFLIIMLFSTPCFAGTSWYVKASCSNNGNGTSPACASTSGGIGAWKNFSNISWGSLTAGDSLLLVTGETWSNQSISVGKAGVTISVYGNGTATIDGGTLNFNAYSNTTIDGVRGDAVAGDTTYGIKFQNYPEGGGCIYSNNGAITNLIVKHVECTGTQQTGGDDQGGIRLSGAATNVEISYNYIHGNSPGAWFISGIDFWGSGTSSDPTNTRIHHNKVTNLRHDGIKCDGGASIYNNVVTGIQGSGHSDSILIQSGGNSRIYNNFISSSDQNIYLDNLRSTPVSNFLIYNNVIDSPAGFGIVLDPEGPSGGGVTNGLDSVHIYNNTFYRTGGPNIRYGGRGSISNAYIKNNIFGVVSNAGDPQLDLASVTMADSNAYDYNVYMTGSSISPTISWYGGTQNTLNNLRAKSPQREIHGKYATPTFSGYQLASGDTVAKNAGVSLASYYTTDVLGITRPQGSGWDIGAYEIQDASINKIPLSPTINSIN